jgi:glyoxylase-like metal-dependent hydrolase (beta-lactamase superfamily II)
VKYGKIKTGELMKFYEVAKDIYAAISPNKGLCRSNAGFINKGRGLVYDTFFDPHHARELKQFCIDSSGHEPAYVVNSHYNCDHTWGNQIFSNSVFIMHENVVWEHLSEKAEFWDGVIRNGDKGGPGEQWLNGQLKGFDLSGFKWQEPDILIKENTTVMLGTTKVEILSVAPAHSHSDLLLWLPEEKVIFCGDIVFESGGYVAYSAEGMRLWMKALDFIVEEMKPEVVVPGHGGICDIEEVRLSSAYFRDLFDQFNTLYTDDISAMDLAKAMNIEKYKHWLQPERLFINVNTLVNDRRGLPNPPDWDYFASQMPELKAHHDKIYGTRIWDPLSSWK